MAISDGTDVVDKPNGNRVHQDNHPPKSAVLHRHLHHNFLQLARAEGHYLILNDGRRIFDASGGAAVACVGVSVTFLFSFGLARLL